MRQFWNLKWWTVESSNWILLLLPKLLCCLFYFFFFFFLVAIAFIYKVNRFVSDFFFFIFSLKKKKIQSSMIYVFIEEVFSFTLENLSDSGPINFSKWSVLWSFWFRIPLYLAYRVPFNLLMLFFFSSSLSVCLILVRLIVTMLIFNERKKKTNRISQSIWFGWMILNIFLSHENDAKNLLSFCFFFFQ